MKTVNVTVTKNGKTRMYKKVPVFIWKLQLWACMMKHVICNWRRLVSLVHLYGNPGGYVEFFREFFDKETFEYFKETAGQKPW